MFFHRGCTSLDTLVAGLLSRLFNWLWTYLFRPTNNFSTKHQTKTILFKNVCEYQPSEKAEWTGKNYPMDISSPTQSRAFTIEFEGEPCAGLFAVALKVHWSPVPCECEAHFRFEIIWIGNQTKLKESVVVAPSTVPISNSVFFATWDNCCRFEFMGFDCPIFCFFLCSFSARHGDRNPYFQKTLPCHAEFLTTRQKWWRTSVEVITKYFQPIPIDSPLLRGCTDRSGSHGVWKDRLWIFPSLVWIDLLGRDCTRLFVSCHPIHITHLNGVNTCVAALLAWKVKSALIGVFSLSRCDCSTVLVDRFVVPAAVFLLFVLKMNSCDTSLFCHLLFLCVTI